MSLAINNTDKLAALRQEAERHGSGCCRRTSTARAPISSGRGCGRQARDPLREAAVKKVGMAAMQALVAVRGDRPFADVTDFASRVDPKQLNKMQIENLVRAGAFDGIAPNRAQLFTGAELVLRRAQSDAEQKESGQIGLFGGAAPAPLRLPDMPDWPPLERLGFEAEAIGFHLTAHPLDMYSVLLKRIGVTGSGQLEALAASGGSRVKVAGCVIARKERPTRTGSKMAWVRLSDAAGSFEVTFFSEALAKCGDVLREGAPIPGDRGSETGRGDAAADRDGGRCRWSRPRRKRARGCGSGSARRPPCRISGRSWRRRARAGAGWCCCRGWRGSRMWRSNCPAGST